MQFLKRIFSLGKDDCYEEAMSFYNNHLYKEAIKLFEKVLERKPASSLHHNLAYFYCGQAHRNLGILQFAMGNFSTALEEFQRVLQFTQRHSEIYHFVGICQNNLGYFEDAVQTFDTILDIDPDNLPTKLKLGIALHNLKVWDRAVSIYSNILQKKPNYADAHFYLGLASLGKGKHSEAVKAFQDALNINPDYIEARQKLGITQAYLGDFSGALSNLKAIAEKFPDYADTQYFLGIVYAGHNRVEDAIWSFKRSLQINPSYKDAKIKIGILYCHTEKFSEGIKELREASGLDPSDGNIVTAIDVIQDMIDGSPYPREKLSAVLGQVFGGDKPIAQTIQEFNKHIKISPDFSAILPIMKYFSEEDTPLCDMLIPFVKDYINHNPSFPDLYNTLGSLYLKLSRPEEAVESFKKAVSLSPDYLHARINLFKTLKEVGRFQEAMVHGEYILAKNLPYPDVYCTMGQIYFSLSMYDKALYSAQKALDINSQYSQVYFLIAQIYEKQGNKPDAIKELEKCLRLNPPEELYIKAKEAIYTLKNA